MASDAPTPRWGFPLETGQSVSYWQRQTSDDELCTHGSNDALPHSIDTVIIGSGITGCLVAKCLRDAQPSRSIAVLEARGFCSGATGRNAGHCKSGSWRVFPRYEKEFGAEQALKILRNEDEAQKALVSYVQENNVECDLWSGSSFEVPVTPSVAMEARKTFLKYRDAGGTVDGIAVDLDPVSAARTTGLQTARACYSRPGATLQPWKLAAHIMREKVATGVQLYSYTVVRGVEPGPDPEFKWIVHTDRGKISCNSVVHATNAYIGAYEPLFREVMVPWPHLCVQARPGSGDINADGLPHSCTVMLPEGANVSINSRLTLDGTLLLGGDNPAQRVFNEWVAENAEHCVNDSFVSVPQVTDGLLNFAIEQFKKPADLDAQGESLIYTSGWSGILGITPDRMPLIGEMPGKEGQWVCVGLNGYGMTKVFTAAPGLVKLMQGSTWQETGLPEAYGMSDERMDRLRKRVAQRV